MVTSVTNDLGPTVKIVELVPLNVQGNGTEATLRKSGVGGSNGGTCRSEVGPVGEVGPQRIKEGAQVWQPHTLRCKTINITVKPSLFKYFIVSIFVFVSVELRNRY